MKNQRLIIDHVAVLDIQTTTNGSDRGCGTPKRGFPHKKWVTPNDLLITAHSPSSCALLYSFCRGRSDKVFLPFWRPFEYFQKSSYAAQPIPKHGFSMLVRKTGEDSVPGTSAKRALRALSISTSGFPTTLWFHPNSWAVHLRWKLLVLPIPWVIGFATKYAECAILPGTIARKCLFVRIDSLSRSVWVVWKLCGSQFSWRRKV